MVKKNGKGTITIGSGSAFLSNDRLKIIRLIKITLFQSSSPLDKLLIVAQVTLALVAVGVGIDLTAPLISALRGHVVVAVPLDATPAHPDVLVDGVIGSVDRDAPELALAHTGHHVTTLSDVGSYIQAVWVVL